jgi:cysteine desulfurase/selenocysteine lyase
LGREAIAAHDQELLEYGTKALESVPGLRLMGRARERSGVLSFLMEDVHAHDVGTILDREGVAIRAGHHCAQPLLACFGVAATVRASLALYNTREDIDALVRGLHKVREVFA